MKTLKIRNRKIIILLLSLIAISGFLLLFFIDVIGVNKPSNYIPGNMSNITGPRFPEYRTVPTNRLVISPLLLTLGVILLSYFFISKKIEKSLENNMKLIGKIIGNQKNKSTERNKSDNKTDAILKLLGDGERKVLKCLVEKNGTVIQSDINILQGMSKLKTHRAVKNLEMRGIVKTSAYGKTKKIILSEDIKNLLK